MMSVEMQMEIGKSQMMEACDSESLWDAEIMELHWKGMAPSEIADTLKCNETYVHDLIVSGWDHINLKAAGL